MLKVCDIHTYYGESQALKGVSLEVKEKSVVALMGRNGMGKTTTIRSIIGFNPPRQGEIYFKGESLTGLQSYQIAQKGIGLVAQGRHIFPSLSVKDNLMVAARSGGKKNPWTLERVYNFFPVLKERASVRGTLLSGGEQQMLAIGRTLMTNPDLIMMDEPSEGLAPKIVEEVGRIILDLKAEGFSIIVVEQNVSLALSVADNVYFMNNGVIGAECVAASCRESGLLDQYLCVT
ncbi:MAG: ABC transporter ATP-binding protein [Christensenella sp.]|nr:ABC transporter ATP-binding protein [Christensenella sp.]